MLHRSCEPTRVSCGRSSCAVAGRDIIGRYDDEIERDAEVCRNGKIGAAFDAPHRRLAYDEQIEIAARSDPRLRERAESVNRANVRSIATDGNETLDGDFKLPPSTRASFRIRGHVIGHSADDDFVPSAGPRVPVTYGTAAPGLRAVH